MNCVERLEMQKAMIGRGISYETSELILQDFDCRMNRFSHTKFICSCLNCDYSHSLPAGEPFDDGSISECDRLVCMINAQNSTIVSEDGCCDEHSMSINL